MLYADTFAITFGSAIFNLFLFPTSREAAVFGNIYPQKYQSSDQLMIFI